MYNDGKSMVEFYAELRRETEHAYLLFDGAYEIWIPISQVDEFESVNGVDYKVSVPEWLAKKKGII